MTTELIFVIWLIPVIIDILAPIFYCYITTLLDTDRKAKYTIGDLFSEASELIKDSNNGYAFILLFSMVPFVGALFWIIILLIVLNCIFENFFKKVSKIIKTVVKFIWKVVSYPFKLIWKCISYIVVSIFSLIAKIPIIW